MGRVPNVTRPCWLWIPAEGEAALLVGFVDQGRFAPLGLRTSHWTSREDMAARLSQMLRGARRIAMEYSPRGELPAVSSVDGGTVEMVRGLGVEVVSSADAMQYAAQRWSRDQLRSHLIAAAGLSAIVQGAFSYIGEALDSGPTEHSVAEFIRRRFAEDGLEVTDGPVVAANRHASDLHFDPTPDAAAVIRPGDWVLIDMWSRLVGQDSMFADITWAGYVGQEVPRQHQRVFDVVLGARDAALAALEDGFEAGRTLQGWEVDRVASYYIGAAGYGAFFQHRLGHSLDRRVHGSAVNLDDWETHDTRRLMPGLAVTIEPGIYLPEFGVRSEIDVYISEIGPQVTTEVQRSVVNIGP